MKKRALLYFALLCLTVTATSLSAQEQEKPKAFFDKGSAGTPLTFPPSDTKTTFFDKGSASTPLTKKRRDIFDSSTSKATRGNTPDFISSSRASSHDAEKKDKGKVYDNDSREESISEQHGKKIINIGAAINGVDQDHLKREIQKLIEAVDKHDLDAGEIFLITQNYAAASDIALPLVVRGGIVTFPAQVPAEYNATISPTWILQTEEGKIVLEGVDDLNRYINKKGEFVEKAQPLKMMDSENRQEFKSFSSLFDTN
ncbi:MAG: hypothetical protein ACOX2O_03615 [Bdellovibrionota bacterium]|jgi:hypothetical protein